MEHDGSVVKITFKGEEKAGILRVGNYGSFLDGVGCGAVTPVKYRVYVHCLGCDSERFDFHNKDGAQFNGPMSMGILGKSSRADYTYEAWFRSPLDIRGALMESHCYDQSELHHQILCHEGCDTSRKAGHESCGEYCDGMEHKQSRMDLLVLYKEHITACRSLDIWVDDWSRN